METFILAGIVIVIGLIIIYSFSNGKYHILILQRWFWNIFEVFYSFILSLYIFHGYRTGLWFRGENWMLLFLFFSSLFGLFILLITPLYKLFEFSDHGKAYIAQGLLQGFLLLSCAGWDRF